MHKVLRSPVARPRHTTVGVLCAAAGAILIAPCALGEDAPDSRPTDARIRVLAYRADEVYRLKGFIGYQIDLEFEPGEAFVGMGTGDLDSLTFAAQDNHLFLKPRNSGVGTNLTVLTTRRAYHFDYSASEQRPDPALGDVIYVLRFIYSTQPDERAAVAVEHGLASAAAARWHNLNYGYRGSPQLQPRSAWDDGVQTRLSFGPQQELPAIFVRNEDGSESLVNFTVEADDLVVHRVARHFIVRRGRLEGCVINLGFTGAGERLKSGTVAPAVERVTKGSRQ